MHQLPDVPSTFTSTQWSAGGGTPARLRTALRRGEVERRGRALFDRVDREPPQEQAERRVRKRRDYLEEVAAALSPRKDDFVASHLSAGALFGLWMPMGDWGRPHLTATERAYPRTRKTPSGTIHHCDSQITEVHVHEDSGLRSTTLARTLADCLRCHGPRISVPLVDHALHEGRVTLEAVEEELRRQMRWQGKRRAAATLDIVDGRRESWLESWGSVWLVEQGFALPEPQVNVFDADGRFIGRTDGLWPCGTAAELDGRMKYECDDPDEISAVMVAEKERRDELDAVGLDVRRWGLHPMLHSPADLALRIRRSLDRADSGRFTGYIRRTDATGLTKVSKWPTSGHPFRQLP